MTDQKTVLIVTGPTASGKSALALAFAQRRNGCVINADAMQTYDTFPILTAQPTAEERAAVPHALYGVLPLKENLSAGRWSVMASAEIERCLAAGRLPIVCGGSGLYIRTLMQGISPIPEVPAAIREQGNADWQTMGGEAFRARLAERDPEIVAALKPEDRQRHVRAWEVVEATGKPLSVWQTGEGTPAPWRFVTVLLSPERPWLRARIELRFDQMLAGGVLAEARAVFDRKPDPTWLGLKAHGAPEFFRHFRGELSIDHARRVAIDHTRQYAKRQMTWFRHQLTPNLVLNPTGNPDLGAPEKLLDKIGV